jgi:hypothetical protein
MWIHEAGASVEPTTLTSLQPGTRNDRRTRHVCSVFARSAPRGALLYPRFSREELGGRFLGPMAHLDPKGEGNNSLPGKQRSHSGV